MIFMTALRTSGEHLIWTTSQADHTQVPVLRGSDLRSSGIIKRPAPPPIYVTMFEYFQFDKDIMLSPLVSFLQRSCRNVWVGESEV
jgi:hypothetical protein